MIEIKNRCTNEILFSVNAQDLREANLYEADLRGADLRGANLHGADLRGADLHRANLYEADLRGADLRGADLRGADLHRANIDGEVITKNPIQILCGLRYVALITDNYMRLGCKRYAHEEWAAFDDGRVADMDDHALTFWKQWREPLLTMCKAHREGG